MKYLKVRDRAAFAKATASQGGRNYSRRCGTRRARYPEICFASGADWRLTYAVGMTNEEFPKKELETLWAPWRVEYFEKEPRDRDFLETAARASDDAEHLVITRRKNSFLMMNRYPYTVGHLMAVPYRKVAELSALGENEVVELWNLVMHAQALLRAAVKAQGFNIGLNLGECAGAGVPDHLHFHVVPRWSGDTNFMPIIGGARVLSDGLRALYDKLMEAQANMASPR